MNEEMKKETKEIQPVEKAAKISEVGKVIIEEDITDGEDQEKALLRSPEASEEDKQQLVKALKRVKELEAKVGQNNTVQNNKEVSNNRKKMETALNYSPNKEQTGGNKETTGQRQDREEKERTD